MKITKNNEKLLNLLQFRRLDKMYKIFLIGCKEGPSKVTKIAKITKFTNTAKFTLIVRPSNEIQIIKLNVK